MSLRAAKKPIKIPSKVSVKFENNTLTIKGDKGTLELNVNPDVSIEIDSASNIMEIKFSDTNINKAIIGTTYANIRNMLVGVTAGYEEKLLLVGVGYKAQLKGNILNLNLGYSHPIDFITPVGMIIEVPTPTEIILKGIDKQKVGQAAAKIRSFRAPEPYKGKGVKYAKETIKIKETKKK